MTIWNFSRFAAISALTFMAGCNTTNSLSFAAAPTPKVTQAKLADGAVTLVTPYGYCVDERSVRTRNSESFALIARCDTLGVDGFFEGHELVMIAVTTVEWTDGAQPSATQLAQSAGGAEVLKQRSVNGVPLLQLRDKNHGVAKASPNYWRGAFVANDQLVGVALYGNEDSAASNDDGGRILENLIVKTRAAN